jgi:hypothetical protein
LIPSHLHATLQKDVFAVFLSFEEVADFWFSCALDQYIISGNSCYLTPSFAPRRKYCKMCIPFGKRWNRTVIRQTSDLCDPPTATLYESRTRKCASCDVSLSSVYILQVRWWDPIFDCYSLVGNWREHWNCFSTWHRGFRVSCSSIGTF